MLVKYREQEFAFELKIRRDHYTTEDGLEQLTGYLDGLGLACGYLIIFDPRHKDWEKKLYMKETLHKGKRIISVGL